MSEIITIHIIAIFIGFLIVFIKHKYIQYKEDKAFFLEVNRMLKQKDKIFLDAFEKSLENMKPFIIDIIKKNSNKNT